MTVLGRLPAHKLIGVDKAALTCVCFDEHQANMVYVGSSCGVITKVNVLEAKVSTRCDMNRAVAIKQIASIGPATGARLLVLTDNKMFEYDVNASKISRSISHSQHK